VREHDQAPLAKPPGLVVLAHCADYRLVVLVCAVTGELAILLVLHASG
jgi:hypothetical protein